MYSCCLVKHETVPIKSRTQLFGLGAELAIFFFFFYGKPFLLERKTDRQAIVIGRHSLSLQGKQLTVGVANDNI